MFDVTYGGAFLAGLLSFVSPCVLPIVPPYMAYLAGLTFDELQDERRDAEATRQLIRAAVGFVLGFSTVFVALGATASLIGQSLARYFDVLRSEEHTSELQSLMRISYAAFCLK